MKEKTIFGRIFSTLVLVIFCIEACNTVSIIVNNVNLEQYGFGGAVSHLFTVFPWWWLLCAVGTLVSGIAAPLAYWMDSPRSVGFASSACSFASLQLLLRFVFRYHLVTFSWRDWVLSMSVAFLALCFAAYVNSCREGYVSERRGWRFLGSD